MSELATPRINREEPPLAELLGFWVSVFGVPESVFTGVWAACQGRRVTFTRREDGQLVSTVQLYLLPCKGVGTVGCIANVATLASHRSKGISSDLLHESIAWMEAEGVTHSYLYAGVPPHYARYGWVESTQDGYRVSSLQEALPPDSSPADLNQMASIYDVTAALRPLAVQRTTDWWTTVLASRIKERLVWSSANAYIVGQKNDDGLMIAETAGNLDEVDQLVRGAAAWAGGAATVHSPEPRRDADATLIPVGMLRGAPMPPGAWFSGLDHF